MEDVLERERESVCVGGGRTRGVASAASQNDSPISRCNLYVVSHDATIASEGPAVFQSKGRLVNTTKPQESVSQLVERQLRMAARGEREREREREREIERVWMVGGCPHVSPIPSAGTAINPGTDLNGSNGEIPIFPFIFFFVFFSSVF